MTLRKTKPEDRQLPAWLDSLIGPLYLDFVAPMPLEEAVKRLKAEEKLGFFHIIYVDLIPYDADTFGFKVRKPSGKNGMTEARGYLKRWDKHTTQVTGQVNVTPFTYILILILLIVITILFFILQLSLMVALYFLFVPIGWYLMRRNCREIAQLIETALYANSPIRW